MAYLFQSNCLICPVDKSGNFLAFWAETRKNTEKPEKTGFGTINETAPGPFFCVFGVKKLRTFYFKLTEQSSRKKLAVGGFEPEKVRLLYPDPLKKPLLSTTTREVFSCISGQNSPQYRKIPLKQGLERLIRLHQPLFFAFRRSNRRNTFRVSLQSKEVGKTAPDGI